MPLATGPTEGPGSSAATPAPAADPPAVQRAREVSLAGFEAAIRLGISLQVPSLSSPLESGTLNEGVFLTVPVGVEVGVRFAGWIFVGADFQYGLLGGSTSSLCQDSPNVNCVSSTVRLGVEALVHPLGNAKLDPWLGLGTGYEWLTVRAGPGWARYGGWEILNIQVGLDVAVSSDFKVGPWFSASIGQYSALTVSGVGADAPQQTLHGWFSFGARLAWLP